MPIRPLPQSLTRYVERPEPTPEEQHQAWLAAQPPTPRRPRHRAPQGRLRVWVFTSLSFGILTAFCGALLLNVVR